MQRWTGGLALTVHMQRWIGGLALTVHTQRWIGGSDLTVPHAEMDWWIGTHSPTCRGGNCDANRAQASPPCHSSAPGA